MVFAIENIKNITNTSVDSSLIRKDNRIYLYYESISMVV